MNTENQNNSSPQMREIVINTCYGGFGLSEKAKKIYCEKMKIDYVKFDDYRLSRTDTLLVEIIKELGAEANDFYANLEIVSLPVGTKYRICEYDGLEHIETIESIRWKIA